MNLYEKHNYLNKDIPYLISSEVIEYDIESAGFNLIKKFKLMNNSNISKLENMTKKDRQIFIGLEMIKNKELKHELNDAFVKVRKLFFENNYINNDDVLSIKKDAIFLLKRVNVLNFDNIIFNEKNIYTSYYYLNKKEFYYNSYVNRLDVKGIGDTNLKLHENYMLYALKIFFRMMEISDRDLIIKTLKDFSYQYKTGVLDVEYYRELSIDSVYKLKHEYSVRRAVYIGSIGEDFKDILDITYNYLNYILPLVSIII